MYCVEHVIHVYMDEVNGEGTITVTNSIVIAAHWRKIQTNLSYYDIPWIAIRIEY